MEVVKPQILTSAKNIAECNLFLKLIIDKLNEQQKCLDAIRDAVMDDASTVDLTEELDDEDMDEEDPFESPPKNSELKPLPTQSGSNSNTKPSLSSPSQEQPQESSDSEATPSTTPTKAVPELSPLHLISGRRSINNFTSQPVRSRSAHGTLGIKRSRSTYFPQ